ncbi:D-glycerate dehydrogenase [Corticibacter populi]|uniref:D-glycerate dehydrogenase n=1 Tax=Corticibacter populi TaxID=1550736 RepID=A0A3M6QK80_9BURK|nr:D-glycerate dehydrogenase [Corticibacter populi]RMX03488.1 D-glycerate dehydrogenase [Corticibacter populi]RZS29928.1 gluconate 2-dehydrogenase [Corticibacter populi]
MTTRPKLLIASPIFPEVVDKLQQHFDVEANRTDSVWTGEAFTSRLADKQAAFLTGAQTVNAQVLAQAPALKIVANMAVGYNNFDVAALEAAGVVGTNTPDVLTETTADFGFALLMATARRITEAEHFLRAGRWDKWRYDMLLGAEVHGSTLGIIGMGRIGQAVARRGVHGFGMQLIYHNRSPLDAATETELKARYAPTIEEVLREADHVVLVLPYTPAVHHLIGAEQIALMKPTATLINIARGGIVDDVALAAALQAGRIAAAGLDVFENEPHFAKELLEAHNVVLTPHIASATRTTRLAMANLAADNLIAFFTTGKALTPVTRG